MGMRAMAAPLWAPVRASVAVLLALLASACGGGSSPEEPDPAPVSDLQVGCDWTLTYDPAQPEFGNTAFPDTSARYFIAALSDQVPAGSTLRLDGQFPDARYSAFHVYDGRVAFLDAIADYEITTDRGSPNRNLDRTRLRPGRDYGGAYVAYLQFGDAPATRAPNTVYRKPSAPTDGEARKRTLIVYRLYLPQGNNRGNVPLPTLTLQTPDGGQTRLPNPADAGACATLAQNLRQASGNATGVSLMRPAVPELKPAFRKFDPTVLNVAGLGIGYNPHNDFMFTKGDKLYGDVLLVRGQRPSYTTQPATPVPQVRYWSICENAALSSSVLGCVTDEDAAVDDEGYYTLAVSDPPMPAGLRDSRGFNWLAWGDDTISVVGVRELLASPGFAESIGNASVLNPAATRGTYMPLATYCSRAVLEQYAPAGAKTAFEMCQASRL